MNNFVYITPQEYFDIEGDSRRLSVKELERIAKRADAGKQTCMVCDEKVWKSAGCDLCFTCTTGESDASDDFELTMNPKNNHIIKKSKGDLWINIQEVHLYKIWKEKIR